MRTQQKNASKVVGLSVAILASFFSNKSVAAEVTGLNTFEPNTPAIADEVNSNFNAIKSAVDDNDTRINVLEEAHSLVSGAVSLSAFAFSNWTAGTHDTSACQFRRLVNYGYFDLAESAGSGCAATAPVHLPHGVTLTGVSCLVVDDINGSTSDTYFYPVTLRRMEFATANTDSIFSTYTISSNSGLQTLDASFTGSQADSIVDNESYAYTLKVDLVFADDVATGENLKLHGCKVTYSTPELTN